MTAKGNSKRLIQDFTEGPINQQLIKFATPLLASNILQIVYNMVDMIVVGQVLGSTGLSGVSVGGDILSFLTFVAMGFSNAGQVLISQLIGRGETKKIGRFIGNMFTFLMCFGILLMVICYCARYSILNAMNTPAESYSQALGYSTVCILGLLFIYGYNAISAVLRGMGDSKHPFIFISIAAVLNLVLDLLFVVVLRMGATGAALATVLGQAVSFLACSIFILRNKEKFELDITLADFIHLEKEHLSALIRLGVPMAIKSAAVQISRLFVNSYINSFGVTVSAFSGVAHKVSQMANQLSQAFNTAGSSMVGQNIGAKKYERVMEIVKAIFKIVFCICTVLAIAFVLFPNQLYGIFTSDPDVLAIGVKYRPIAVLMFYGCCARSGMNALINGSGNTRVNFATAILDGVVMRIGLALLLGVWLDFGAYGFWTADAIAGFTPLFIGLIFIKSGAWKKGRS